MHDNPELQLANEFIRTTGSHLFLTGKAGTGKTTFLHTLKKDEILVEPLTWENIKYRVDSKSKEITEEVIGKFTQFPLRPAWAITMHKSQGLTFEKAVIDVNAAFSHGQVYVALSRCKTFEGMVLSSPISPRAVKTDDTVARFMAETGANPPEQTTLHKAKIDYQQQLLLECFNFQPLGKSLGKLTAQLRNHRHLIYCAGIEVLEQMTPGLFDRVVAVSEKFQLQLQALFKPNTVPEEDVYIQERVQKATLYFSDQLQAELAGWVSDFNLTTDNREIKKQITKTYQTLKNRLVTKQAALKTCHNGFSTSAYLNAVSRAELDQAQTSKVSADTPHMTESKHPQLLQELNVWRAQQAANQQVHRF